MRLSEVAPVGNSDASTLLTVWYRTGSAEAMEGIDMTTITRDERQITALVTGANRGLGQRFAAELIARGAKVYAARDGRRTVDIPGAIPVQLDITDPESVRRAAEIASDVNVLVNNAGVSTQADVLSGSMDDIRLEMETHYFGTLQVTRAFAPVIERNGGGSILNVLSVLSWVHAAEFGAYAAAKAAGWAMTDALREELAPRGVHVAALHVGFMDTDMADSSRRPENRSRGGGSAGAGRLVRGRTGDPRR